MYTVTVDENGKRICTCSDFTTNGGKCQHVHASIFRVEYPKVELVDPPTAPTVQKRKTYPQDWPNYNRAQTQEKSLFMQLLAGLCDLIPDEEPKRGRPRIPLQDAAFLACYKVYERSSARRFMSDVGIAVRSGYISREPHFNSIINAMNNPALTNVLLDFIRVTSLPFKDFEHTFAADSSGFTSSKYDRWLDIKSPKLRQEHTWTKVHLMCGTSTHIVTAVTIKGKNASDTVQLPYLLETTAKNFDVLEVCADKAYGSLANYKAIGDAGAVPFIPFKSNQNGAGKGRSGKGRAKKGGGEQWSKMFHMFQYHKKLYLAHYHKRSNVETVFAMIKAKFGGDVRSKTEVGALNEVLCKIVCHNVCCLISAMFELGLKLDHLFPEAPLVRNFQVIQGGLEAHGNTPIC
jgi:hypothetical protein